MKKFLFSLLMLLSSMAILADNEPTLQIGQEAPVFTTVDTLGVKHSLKDFRGDYVVVDFWASWCGDCRREIPGLIRLEQTYRNQTIDGHRIQWLGVSFDHEREAWKNALRKYQMPWMQISDGVKWKDNKIAKKYDLHWIPTFFVLDPEGKVAGSGITAEQLEAVLQRLTGIVQLPAADLEETSCSVVEALAERHSVRSFDKTPLTQQQLGNLCWAARGSVRGGRFLTSPTARNLQEIRLFVFTEDAAYEYLSASHQLRFVADGDHRGLLATNDISGKGFSQDFVCDAPVSLVMVIDYDIFGSNGEGALKMGCVDAGIMSENVNLYCQAVGLATVPRATMDVKALRELLGLTDQQLPIMNNPVGFEK